MILKIISKVTQAKNIDFVVKSKQYFTNIDKKLKMTRERLKDFFKLRKANINGKIHTTENRRKGTPRKI